MNDVKKVSEGYLDKLQKFYNNDFDVHKNNLIKKLNNTISGDKSAAFKNTDDVKNFIDPYIKYRTEIDLLLLNLNPSNIDDSQTKMVKLLQTYKDEAYNINNIANGQYFTAQSKYEPTILEEFMGFLLSPLIKDLPNIKCGPVKAYSEMSIEVSIDSNNKAIVHLEQKTKNQGFILMIILT